MTIRAMAGNGISLRCTKTSEISSFVRNSNLEEKKQLKKEVSFPLHAEKFAESENVFLTLHSRNPSTVCLLVQWSFFFTITDEIHH